MDTYFFAQQVQRNWYDTTLEKKGARDVSVGQQQQQLSIETLTNLPIKTSPSYYRKSAVLKQKARSRSRYTLP